MLKTPALPRRALVLTLGLALALSCLDGPARAQDPVPSDAGGNAIPPLRVIRAVDATRPAPMPTSPFGALDPATQERFAAIPDDPAPRSLIRNAHYVVSNEQGHHHFTPYINNLGGVQAGVGTDQLYLLAGWSRPEILVPTDFDAVVVDVHYIYGAFFKVADTSDAFRDLWSPKSEAEALRLLAPLAASRPKIMKTYAYARLSVYSRLKRLKRAAKRSKTKNFLNDAETYTFISDLWRQGRVFPIRADLTARTAFLGLADACRASNLSFTLLYLSNAEQYFNYGEAFMTSMNHLPWGNGLILRTWPGGKKADYTYYIQQPNHLNQWLISGASRNFKGLKRARKPLKRHLYKIDGPPERLR